MRLIVGLGNPGRKYEKTRHNAGFLALDRLAREKKLSWRLENKANGLSVRLGDDILFKPQTFMNESGRAVLNYLTYYHCPFWPALKTSADFDLTRKLIVIHDDLDIALGECRISADSRSAGHKGVQSIIDFLGTKRFTRFRLGLKNDHQPPSAAEKYVLEKFSAEELVLLDQAIAMALEKIQN